MDNIKISAQPDKQKFSMNNLIINVTAIGLLAFLFVVMALPFYSGTETTIYTYTWYTNIYGLIHQESIFIALLAVICLVLFLEIVLFLFYFFGRANNSPHKYISKKLFQIMHFVTACLLFLTMLSVTIYALTGGLDSSGITIAWDIGFFLSIVFASAITVLKITLGIRINKNDKSKVLSDENMKHLIVMLMQTKTS